MLTLLFLLAGCGKTDKIEKGEDNRDLLERIRETYTAAGITIDVERTESAPDSSLVTFHNCTVSVDTRFLKDFRAGIIFKEGILPVKMKELVFNFKPQENYLGLVGIKGMFMEWDFNTPGPKKGKLLEMGLKVSSDNIQFEEYDVSPLLNSNATTATELMIELFANNQVMTSTTENMNYRLNYTTKEGKKASVLFESGKVEGSQSMNPDIFLSLYTKKVLAAPPDFPKILEMGSPIFDISLRCDDARLTVYTGGRVTGSGSLDKLAFSYFLKPGPARKHFTYGAGLEVKNLKASTPGDSTLAFLSRVKELKAKLSVVDLSSGFAQAYFELLKKSAELSETAKPDDLRKVQSAMGMKIFMEFMKSKPGLEISISPFIHEIGELEAHGKFRFSGISIPEGRAKVKIKNANDLLDTLRKGKDLPPLISHLLLNTLSGMLKIDDRGNGFILFETHEEYPGQFFINGKPVRK
jgi:hypothetical protein